MVGLPVVNGADRPTPAVLDGAVRPLPSSSSRAHAGSTAPPPGRDREPKGADMGSMRKTRSMRTCAGEMPRGQYEPLIMSAGCHDKSVTGGQRGVSMNT